MEEVKFSVVTVCKNCIRDIGNTIESVLSQDYDNFEYVIVDGVSTDGTAEIIQRYKENDSRIVFVSEADRGIYDAMNKAAGIATGDFIQFINAGDKLYSNDTLSRVAAVICRKKGDIFYGDSLYLYGDGRTMMRHHLRSSSWNISYMLEDSINHQAIFAAKNCFGRVTFDEGYRVGADRDWMIRMKKAGKRWYALKFPVAVFKVDEDSFSIRNQDLAFKEIRQQTRKYYPVFGSALSGILRMIRNGKVTSRILHFISDRTLFRQE